jgi:molybdopterin-synthase adenylyltransferase
MIEIRLCAEDFNKLRTALVAGESEKCAVLFANGFRTKSGDVRLLVRELEFPDASEYSRQGYLEAELRPAYVARVTKRARIAGTSIIFAHSHPGEEPPFFSHIDSEGEDKLSRFLAHRLVGRENAALVISSGGARARSLGKSDEIRIVTVGTERQVVFDPTEVPRSADDQYDRQIRAFGAACQASMQKVRVGIVGLGGIGSIVAQELAHLGVRDFVLLDPDVIESTNLNRVANACLDDVGVHKVEVAANYIRRVVPGARVRAIPGDIIRTSMAKEITDCDFAFGCTDSHGSRAILQQVSYQYLIPCIDTGTTIIVSDGRIKYIYGRVQMIAPGLSCFTCNGLLDGNEVRRDMMTAFERQLDPYIQGAREPAPAVMSINGTVASLAVTMFLSSICGVPSLGRYLLYDAMTCNLRTIRGAPQPNCIVCSHSGGLARGDSSPLFGRQD